MVHFVGDAAAAGAAAARGGSVGLGAEVLGAVGEDVRGVELEGVEPGLVVEDVVGGPAGLEDGAGFGMGEHEALETLGLGLEGAGVGPAGAASHGARVVQGVAEELDGLVREVDVGVVLQSTGSHPPAIPCARY